MPKRQRTKLQGSPRSDSSNSSTGSSSSRHSYSRQSDSRNSASMSQSDEVVQRLCSIFSDMRVEVARYLLEACNWDLEKAVQLHLENPTEVSRNSSSSEIPEHANRFNSLVINDDSDDEIPPVRQRTMSPNETMAAVPLPNRRSPDNVRAPIAPQQMRLVDGGMERPIPGTFRPLHYARSIPNQPGTSNGNSFRAAVAASYEGRASSSGSTFDRYRFMASDTLPRTQQNASSSNEDSRTRSHQFPPPVLANGASMTEDESSGNSLDRIFRPPIDLLYRGTFQEARRFATSANRWLIVNVQELDEFPSLCLNRDVWREKKFLNMIEDNLILWQVYNDSNEGSRFAQFYKITGYPFVGIIDPITGERVLKLPLSPTELFQKLSEFLIERPHPDMSPKISPTKKPKVTENGVGETGSSFDSLSSDTTPTNISPNGQSSVAPVKESSNVEFKPPDASRQAESTISKPKQMDVTVCPGGSAVFFNIMVHLPNDNRLLIKLYEAATLQELVTAISHNFETVTAAEFMLIRNASHPGGAKSDLLALSMPAHSVTLKDTLKFCKREKLFLDSRQ